MPNPAIVILVYAALVAANGNGGEAELIRKVKANTKQYNSPSGIRHNRFNYECDHKFRDFVNVSKREREEQTSRVGSSE